MNKIVSVAAVVGLTAFIYRSFSQKPSTITLTVTNIQSTKGSVLVAVFKDEQSFKKEKSYKKFKLSKASLANAALQTEISLQPGTYGISVLDDANDNGRMDYNFVGIPKEGFGFADYYHGGMSRPDFDDFKFELKKDVDVAKTAKFRYV